MYTRHVINAADQQPEDLDLSKRLHGAVADTLSHLEVQLAVVRVRLGKLGAGGFDPDLARAGAALSRAVKEVAGEWRQLEKHDRQMTLTPEQRFRELVKYVRAELGLLERQELGRVLATMDRERTA